MHKGEILLKDIAINKGFNYKLLGPYTWESIINTHTFEDFTRDEIRFVIVRHNDGYYIHRRLNDFKNLLNNLSNYEKDNY